MVSMSWTVGSGMTRGYRFSPALPQSRAAFRDSGQARLSPPATLAGEFAVPESRIYSIGHSNHPIEKFLRLLEQHRIELLVDVRSVPASRFAPQFGHARLRTAVVEAGRDYVFLGKELGGRPEGTEYYDEDGHVLYGRRAGAPDFVAGLERIAALAAGRRL